MNPSSIPSPAQALRSGVALLWVSGLLSLVACGPAADQPGASGATQPAATEATAAKPAMTVTLTRPRREPLAVGLAANGNIAAWQEASVGAELNGLRLSAVNVNVGDVVKKGQVLALLAGETTQAESLQSRAAQMQAEASYQNAKADADRVRSIQDTGALSASQIAQYLTAEKVAMAQWEAAKAAYGATQVRLANTRVLAPDDGVISARSASVGAVVGAGQELFRLVRGSRMEWRAEVTPTEVGRIHVGQAVQVTAATGAELTGKVRAIAPGADPQTRNVLVFVDLPRHSDLKTGTFARGRFELGKSEGMTVPAQALVVRDGHSYVFVIGADSKANQRQVQIGRRVGDRVEVLSGLKADESVAVQGAGFLNEGDLVKVTK
jgi:HlyD family secretion protein